MLCPCYINVLKQNKTKKYCRLQTFEYVSVVLLLKVFFFFKSSLLSHAVDRGFEGCD